MRDFLPWEPLEYGESNRDCRVEMTTGCWRADDDGERDTFTRLARVGGHQHVPWSNSPIVKAHPIWKMLPNAVTPSGEVPFTVKLHTDAIPGKLQASSVNQPKRQLIRDPRTYT